MEIVIGIVFSGILYFIYGSWKGNREMKSKHCAVCNSTNLYNTYKDVSDEITWYKCDECDHKQYKYKSTCI